MAIKLVNVTKSFTLTVINAGKREVLRIEQGVQKLEEEIADHWYTKSHSADVPDGVTASQNGATKQADPAKK